VKVTTLMRPLAGLAAVLVLAACGGNGARNVDIRQWTDDMSFRISVTPLPPIAEEVTTFKVVVQDKESGQPIEAGQGRIFATSVDRAQVNDGLAKGKEVGTYYAHIRFPVAGEWSVGMQFRRDSTSVLERTQDWQQAVHRAPPLGSDTTTH
jgi:hypothetical protein